MTPKQAVETTQAPAAIGPYSQGIVAGGFVYTSGQLPVTSTGQLITEDIALATRTALENVSAVLQAAGSGVEHVVKVTVYLTNLSDFSAMNEAYREMFAEPYPARSCVEVAGLPKGSPIEIEAVATLR